MNELVYTSPECATLKISGSLTIPNIISLYDLFISSLNLVGELNIDHEAGEEFDFTYLQLLTAIKKTAIHLNKKIKVDCKQPESFIQLTLDLGCPEFIEKININ